MTTANAHQNSHTAADTPEPVLLFPESCQLHSTECPQAITFAQEVHRLHHAAILYLETEIEEDDEKTNFLLDVYDREDRDTAAHVAMTHPKLLDQNGQELHHELGALNAEFFQ